MKSHQLYCGACDRPVRVLITEQALGETQAPVRDAEFICLEIGTTCTGRMCTLGADEPSAMVRRIVRNGIPLDSLETVPAHCPTCDRETEMILYGSGQAGCSTCGSTGRWVIDHLEPA